jgi:hypothetical protein
MFKFLSRLFKPTKSNIDRGFDFGKSMIDKCGNDGIEYLERKIDESRIFGSFNDFDLGIIDAIQQHRQSSVA